MWSNSVKPTEETGYPVLYGNTEPSLKQIRLRNCHFEIAIA
ncbi:hypothetical protein [Limnofasciculus baicalensis]|nr:hypothetical protein [Limnofasciculus baicalensis]